MVERMDPQSPTDDKSYRPIFSLIVGNKNDNSLDEGGR